MTDGQISPLAPKAFAELPPIDGAVMAVAEAGIKYQGRKDLLLMAFPQGAAVAGVLTRSKTASAPVDWCREHLVGGFARGLVVNSGNANAFTGKRGHDAVQLTAEQAARALDCKPEEVFLASTGVIGEPLDASAFGGLLKSMAGDAASSGWQDAAAAIMTTDTFPKVATATAMIDGVPVTLNGIAKGSGMIAPDMATMLSFIVTDAPLSADVLARVLKRSADVSFNAITVDSDTSTSDTVLLFATGEAAKRGAPPITDPADRRLVGFRKALATLSLDLAHQIVRDGEGASKFISVTVEGAGSRRSARTIAMAIANSPLVKTAIAGEDANWGRIVMAVGKSGEPADRDLLAIWFGDIQVARDGERHPNYSEEAVSALMKHDAIDIRVDLGLGRSQFTAWTCDLTHGYISINADYRS